MRRQGRDLPLWITEIGWPTTPWEGSGQVAAGVQADYLVRMVVLSLAAGVQRVFWRCFRDRDQFGLVQSDFTPKPALVAYRTLTRLLAGAECRGRVEAPHGVWTVAFRKHDQDLLVCWAPDQAIPVDLLGSSVRRWDVAGQPARLADGPLRVVLGPSPLYAVGHDLRVVSRDPPGETRASPSRVLLP